MRSRTQGYQKALSQNKKFRDFNSDWLPIIKFNAGMLPFSNWAMVRLYQVTGMLRIPNWFVKETEICVFKDALRQKRIKKYRIQNILYSISDKYREKNALDALEIVSTSNLSRLETGIWLWHSRCTRRISMNCIMIFISRTKWCSAESKGGFMVI